MPLLWFSLAFFGGTILADYLPLRVAAWGLVAGAALLLVPLGLSLQRAPVLARLTAGFSPPAWLPSASLSLFLPLLIALGGLRASVARPNLLDPTFIACYNDQQGDFVVEGLLVEPPDVRDTYTNLRVAVEALRRQDEALSHPVHGLLLVKVQPGSDWRYGDRLQLRGPLQTPPVNETFSYRDYLARQGIYSLMPYTRATLLARRQGNPLLASIYALKALALSTIYRLYPDPEASLMAGILLGVETGIPQRVQEAFKATGTSHIVAISGFNIAIVAGLFARIFSTLLGPRRGAVTAILGIAVYTLLVGAQASVVRAATMGGLSILAAQFGRRQDGLNSLAFTAALMALLNPLIYADVGFQLSFAATLGLILYADPFSQAFAQWLSHYLPPETTARLVGPVSEYVLFTLAAQLLTLPIMAYHFGRLSLVAFLVNPLVLPVQPPVMILGGLAVILGIIWLPLGQIASYLAWPFVLFTIRTVELFAAFPQGNLILGRIALPLIVLFYAGIFVLTAWGRRLRQLLGTLGPGLPLAALALTTVLAWRALAFAPDGKLHVTLLDVSASGRSGDAILLQSPSGRYLLINGGPLPTRLSDALGRRLPVTHRQLDWLVVAASDEEQIAALPASLDRFPPNAVLWAGPTHASQAARNLQEAFAVRPITVRSAESGQLFDLGGGAGLRVLTAGKRGLILLVEYDYFRMVLPLSPQFADFEALDNGRLVGPVTALLLADNGYAASNPATWIDNLHPQLILLSVAADDRRGLPDSETLAAMQGYTLLRTDQQGWIELISDGKSLWVQAERPLSVTPPK